MERPASILITGASGFIGQHLLEELEQSPFKIKVLTIESNPRFRTASDQFEIFQGDIANITEIEIAVKNVDVIIHLAAEIHNSKKYEATNIKGVANLAELAKKYDVKKFIHLSSVGIYGLQYSSKEILVSENNAANPVNGYEISKWKSEHVLQQSFKDSNIKLYILRPTNVFGEHHTREQLLNFLQYLKKNKRIFYFSKAKVNYLYVKDLSKIIHHLITQDINSTIFNIGKALQLNQFVQICEKYLKIKIRKYKFANLVFKLITVLIPANYKGYVKSLYNRINYKSDLLNQEFSFEYQTDQGMKNTIAYYRESQKL